MVLALPSISLAMRTLGSLNPSPKHVRMKKLFAGLASLALALVMVGCSATEPQEELDQYAGALMGNEKRAIDPVAMEDEVLQLENRHRAAMGLKPLEDFPAVYPYARSHNEYMIAQNKLSHDNFESRAEKVAEESQAIRVSENVAVAYYSAELVLEQWLESSAHRKALEGEFTHTSLSISLDKTGRPFFTQLFMQVAP